MVPVTCANWVNRREGKGDGSSYLCVLLGGECKGFATRWARSRCIWVHVVAVSGRVASSDLQFRRATAASLFAPATCTLLHTTLPAMRDINVYSFAKALPRMVAHFFVLFPRIVFLTNHVNRAGRDIISTTSGDALSVNLQRRPTLRVPKKPFSSNVGLQNPLFAHIMGTSSMKSRSNDGTYPLHFLMCGRGGGWQATTLSI